VRWQGSLRAAGEWNLLASLRAARPFIERSSNTG